jgi:streptogramin lyase
MDVGFGAIWAASCATSTINRIDATTGVLQAEIPVDAGTFVNDSSVAAGEGGVWVLAEGATSSVVEIDPAVARVVRVAPAPPRATAVRAGFGAVWVTASILGRLTRLDRKNLTVVATIAVEPGGRYLAIGHEAVWVFNVLTGTSFGSTRRPMP